MDIFRINALINLVIFILFFIIGIIIQKLRGINPVGQRKNENRFMLFIIVFSTVLLIFLWFSYIINIKQINHILYLPLIEESLIIKYMASFILCVATLIEIMAGLTLDRSFRIHSPAENEQIELVNKGIYGIIRNPVVLGLFLYALSITLLNPNIFSLLMLIITFMGFNYKVNTETEELSKRLGDSWQQYLKSTGKYLPRFFNKCNKYENNK